MTGKDISMEMISIPFEEYNELFQLRLELHMIYSKCRKDGALEAGMFADELMKMLHSDVFPLKADAVPVASEKVPKVISHAEQL